MYFYFFGNVSFGVYTETETRTQPSDRSEWVLSIEYSNLAWQLNYQSVKIDSKQNIFVDIFQGKSNTKYTYSSVLLLV